MCIRDSSYILCCSQLFCKCVFLWLKTQLFTLIYWRVIQFLDKILRGTHRFIQRFACNASIFCPIYHVDSRLTNQKPLNSVRSVGCQAVSYTHLDVYKRQVLWVCTVLLGYGSCFAFWMWRSVVLSQRFGYICWSPSSVVVRAYQWQQWSV